MAGVGHVESASRKQKRVSMAFALWSGLLVVSVLVSVIPGISDAKGNERCAGDPCVAIGDDKNKCGVNLNCKWDTKDGKPRCETDCAYFHNRTLNELVARGKLSCEKFSHCEWKSASDGSPAACAKHVANAGSQQLIGIAIEFAGTTLSVCGLNGQKWALMQTKGQDTGAGKGANALVAFYYWLRFNWRWACAFSVFLIGQITISAALNYGTQAVLTTITALSVVTNAIIAMLVFDKPFAWKPRQYHWGAVPVVKGWDLGACVLIIVGVALCAVFAPLPPDDLVVNEATACPDTEVFRAYFEGIIFLVWFFIIIGIAMTCWMRIFVFIKPGDDERSRARSHALSLHQVPSELRGSNGRCAYVQYRLNLILDNNAYMYGILCAMVGALSITFSKPGVSLLHWGFAGGDQATLGIGSNASNVVVTLVYILGLASTAVSNLVFLNLGMRDNDPNVVYPLYSVLNTVIVALTGTILYQTYNGWLWWHVILFIVGFAMTLAGLYFLVADRQDEEYEADVQAGRRKTLADMDESGYDGGESATAGLVGSMPGEVEMTERGNKGYISESLTSSSSPSIAPGDRASMRSNPVMADLGVPNPTAE